MTLNFLETDGNYSKIINPMWVLYDVLGDGVRGGFPQHRFVRDNANRFFVGG